jgi:flagellar assembly protein FliH
MASVLKADGGGRHGLTGGAIGFNLDDFAQQGKQQLEAAHFAARKLIEEAQQQAKQILEQARQQGRQDGLREAEATVQGRIDAETKRRVGVQLPQLTQAAEALRQGESAWLEQWRATTVQLAVAMSERVVRRELQLDPSILHRWAEEAVAAVRAARQVVLCVHPETLAQRGEELDAILQAADLADAVIQPDERVDPSGIVIRQEGGRLDMQLQTQLARLSEQLSL